MLHLARQVRAVSYRVAQVSLHLNTQPISNIQK
nr:MAG TPA: hypothetical protein [Caudoviricetes sp.]